MRLGNSLITRIGTLALAGYVAWSGWTNLKPEKPQLGEIRKDLADDVICTIVVRCKYHPVGYQHCSTLSRKEFRTCAIA